MDALVIPASVLSVGVPFGLETECRTGIQIEHIFLNPLGKIYFDKNSSHRFDAIAKLVKDAYSPFCRHKILRTDDAVGLHLIFFMKRFHHILRIATSDATDHKADRLPPPTVLIFAFFSFLLTSCPIHLLLVYHFLFRKIQLKTFLAAALAAACSLERMMLFCQMEPKLFMKLHIFPYKSKTYIYI